MGLPYREPPSRNSEKNQYMREQRLDRKRTAPSAFGWSQFGYIFCQQNLRDLRPRQTVVPFKRRWAQARPIKEAQGCSLCWTENLQWTHRDKRRIWPIRRAILADHIRQQRTEPWRTGRNRSIQKKLPFAVRQRYNLRLTASPLIKSGDFSFRLFGSFQGA